MRKNKDIDEILSDKKSDKWDTKLPSNPLNRSPNKERINNKHYSYVEDSINLRKSTEIISPKLMKNKLKIKNYFKKNTKNKKSRALSTKSYKNFVVNYQGMSGTKRLGKVVNQRYRNNSSSTSKLSNDLDLDLETNTKYETPKPYFLNSSGKKKITCSNLILNSHEKLYRSPYSISNMHSARHSFKDKRFFNSLQKASYKKPKKTPNIVNAGDLENLQEKLNNLEEQLKVIRKTAWHQSSKIEKKQPLLNKEKTLESRISCLNEKICSVYLKDQSIISNGTRNKSIKLEPKLLVDTLIERIDTPKDPNGEGELENSSSSKFKKNNWDCKCKN